MSSSSFFPSTASTLVSLLCWGQVALCVLSVLVPLYSEYIGESAMLEPVGFVSSASLFPSTASTLVSLPCWSPLALCVLNVFVPLYSEYVGESAMLGPVVFMFFFIWKRKAGSDHWCDKGFFSHSQLPVHTLLWSLYGPHVQSHASTSVRTLTFPQTGSQPYHCLDTGKLLHTLIGMGSAALEYCTHTLIGMGSAVLEYCTHR